MSDDADDVEDNDDDAARRFSVISRCRPFTGSSCVNLQHQVFFTVSRFWYTSSQQRTTSNNIEVILHTENMIVFYVKSDLAYLLLIIMWCNCQWWPKQRTCTGRIETRTKLQRSRRVSERQTKSNEKEIVVVVHCAGLPLPIVQKCIQ